MASRPDKAPQLPVRSASGSPRTAGQRAGVSHAAVLEAAQSLAAREGLDRLTMRRLAAELGVAPNALYTYFPNKTALLDAVLDAVLGELQPPDVAASAWQDGVAELMRAARRLLLAHPHLVPLFVARQGGTNALRLGELTLQLLARGGVGGRCAVEALRALLVYMLGFVAVEVPRATHPEGAGRLARMAARIERLPAEQFPATRALARDLAAHPGDRDFEAGLRWLLAGIARDARPE